MRLLSALRARLFGKGGDADPNADAAMSTDDVASAEQPVHEAETVPSEQAAAALEPPASPAAADFQDAVPGRQERAAGRILEDEGLRGDLTDDEFQPLLDWALAQTDRAAAATASQDDGAADVSIDAAVSAIREVLRAAQDAIVAHAEGRSEDRRYALDAISQAWKPSLAGGDDTDLPRTLWQPLQQLADRLDVEPDLPGSEVAAAIVAALTPEPASLTEVSSGDEESAS